MPSAEMTSFSSPVAFDVVGSGSCEAPVSFALKLDSSARTETAASASATAARGIQILLMDNMIDTFPGE